MDITQPDMFILPSAAARLRFPFPIRRRNKRIMTKRVWEGTKFRLLRSAAAAASSRRVITQVLKLLIAEEAPTLQVFNKMADVRLLESNEHEAHCCLHVIVRLFMDN